MTDVLEQNGRASARAAGTRRALLAAARDVFAGSGFAEASIAEVVAKAGASVGSLYHHFGGKADLYVALFEEYQQRQEARASAAVARARAGAEAEPIALFVAGCRAYLDGCWVERDLARLFLAGGGPSGFDIVVRRRDRAWIRQNATLLRDEPLGEALVLILTTVAGAAGREVAVCDDEEVARALADDVLVLISRIATAER